MPLEYRFADELESCDGPVRSVREKRSADGTLARFAVEEALAPHRRTLRRKGGIAVVVEVPSGAWVDPVTEACGRLFRFDKVYGRNGSSRSEHRSDKGAADAAERLARGERILGVAPSPKLHLPSPLVASADVSVRIGDPSAAVIAKVVRAATGGSAPVQPGAAAGLDLHEIVAAIRVGDTAAQAIGRLEAARAAKAGGDALADAPPFETLAGLGEAHRFGMDLIRSVRAYREGADIRTLGGRAAVIASAPGLGKTSMMRSLAKSTGLPLVSTSVAEWFVTGTGYLDSLLRIVDETFARANGDCLIHLDECDAIPSRETLDSRNREWWTTVVTHLLLRVETTLARRDRFVAIVGSTNHGDRLDPALVRPGRLDRVIRIGLPEVEDLAIILRQHLGPDLPGADLLPFAQLVAGSTGARAAMIVRDARARAGSEGRPVAMGDLVAVVEPDDPLDPADFRRACLHEAGHAVVSERTDPGRLKSINVMGDGRAGGSIVRSGRGKALALRRDVEVEAVSLLSGRAAELAILGEASSGAGGANDSDLARATLFVARLHGSLGLGKTLTFRGSDEALLESLRYDTGFARAVEADLARLMAEALELVERERGAIEAVAAALAERRAMSGDEVRDILAGLSPR